jgi:hypothetical protein
MPDATDIHATNATCLSGGGRQMWPFEGHQQQIGLLEGSPMDIASVYDWFARDSMQAAEQTADCAGRS